MLRVGIVGFGFMGRMHYRCWKALGDVQVAAICDADPNALDNAAETHGNIAGAEGEVDMTGVQFYTELGQMIRQESLDAVSITVPTHLHPDATVAALEAGVHVLCEKPMALHVAEANRMIEAARRSRKLLQIGHCIRFWPEYAKAKEIVDSGEYGRVIAATFQRLAATGVRKAGTWFTDDRCSGGMPLDLHIHDTDYIHYLFGMPQAVCSSGAIGAGGSLSHIVTSYSYADGKLVVGEGGWVMMPPYGFAMRFHIALERATLDFDFQRTPKLRLCPAEGQVIVPECESGDGYSCQIAHFARCLRGEPVVEVITPEQARDSLRIVEAERQSAKDGIRVALEVVS